MLELTVPVEHDQAKDVVRALHKLRDRGLRLAVDNAGDRPPANILELHPDIFKLDVRGDGERQRRQRPSGARCRALCDSGWAPRKSILVAEGIETEAEFEMLRSLGCRYGQGYYLGRPGRLRGQGAPPRRARGSFGWTKKKIPLRPLRLKRRSGTTRTHPHGERHHPLTRRGASLGETRRYDDDGSGAATRTQRVPE